MRDAKEIGTINLVRGDECYVKWPVWKNGLTCWEKTEYLSLAGNVTPTQEEESSPKFSVGDVVTIDGEDGEWEVVNCESNRYL